MGLVEKLKDEQVAAVVDICYGDSGKGKLVDYLARNGDFNVVARVSGGANTGATVLIDNKDVILHLIPLDIFADNVKNIITGMVYFDPDVFLEDLKTVKKFKSSVISYHELLVDENLPVVLPHHKALDLALNYKLGTTGRGIGLVAADFMQRRTLTINDLFEQGLEDRIAELIDEGNVSYIVDKALNNKKISDDVKTKLNNLNSWYQKFNPRIITNKYRKLAENVKPFVGDAKSKLNNFYNMGRKILIEGTQGVMLDAVNGDRPFVSSSPVTTHGLLYALGIGVDKCFTLCVMKALPTKVGAGALPTKIIDKQLSERLREKGKEYGATTGRPRDLYWHSIPALTYALSLIPRPRGLVISKVDTVAGEELFICNNYRDKTNFLTIDYPRSQKILENIEACNIRTFGPIENVSQFKSLNDLKGTKLSRYIKYFEDQLNIKVLAVGNGKNSFIE